MTTQSIALKISSNSNKWNKKLFLLNTIFEIEFSIQMLPIAHAYIKKKDKAILGDKFQIYVTCHKKRDLMWKKSIFCF